MLILACERSRDAPVPEPAPEPAARRPVVVPPPAELAFAGRGESWRLEQAFARARAELGAIDATALARTRPDYLAHHGLDVAGAAYRRGFVDAFQLDEDALVVLDRHGFVVVPIPPGPDGDGGGPVDLYYRVFAADLPLFVTADSILHAWHRSYDDILEATEHSVLVDELRLALTRLENVLDTSDASQRDALIYVAVAHALLDGADAPSTAVDAEVAAIVAQLDRRTRVELPLAGSTRPFDASQLIARGHYADSESLARYFAAMMWLGRVDLELHDPRHGGSTRPGEERAARALAGAAQRSGALAILGEIEAFYAVHVGRPNALDLGDVLRACRSAGMPGCRGDARDIAAAYASAGASAYATAAATADPTPEAVVTMRLFPQRFAYDAWITSKTTSPRLQPALGPDARTMAQPYDVAYVLGSDRAREQLAAELELSSRAELPGTLAALRRVFVEIPPLAVDETIYNHWLAALAVLARPDVDPALPRVLRTAAWHDRRLEATLASWAELRHDTVLVVDQSQAMSGCQYPEGYVEPVPELYRALADAAAHLASLYADPDGPGRTDWAAEDVRAWAQHFRDTMEQLAVLAEHERAGLAPTRDEIAFLSHAVDRHRLGYGGSRSYDGWYAALYHRAGRDDPSSDPADPLPHVEGARAEPIVADVHTDGVRGEVLALGVGRPELLIVALDLGGRVALHAGPVSSLYGFTQPLASRMTDDAWRARTRGGPLPPRPGFARAYRPR